MNNKDRLTTIGAQMNGNTDIDDKVRAHKVRVLLGLLSLLLLSPRVHASNPPSAPSPATIIEPGDGRISGAVLRPYDNVWAYTVTMPNGEKRRQGLWTDTLEKKLVEGVPALVRVQGITFVNGRTSSTVNTFDPITLAPLSGWQQGVEGQTQSRTFKDHHVSAIRKDKAGVETKTDVDLPNVPFDFNAGMYGLILVGIDLRDGFEGQFEAIEESSEDRAIESFRVLGKEPVAAGALGTVAAWKVVVERPGQYKMMFWLVRKPPYILKLEYSTSDRPEIWDWIMI